MSYASMINIVLCAGMMGVQLGLGHERLIPPYALLLVWQVFQAWRECWMAEA